MLPDPPFYQNSLSSCSLNGLIRFACCLGIFSMSTSHGMLGGCAGTSSLIVCFGCRLCCLGRLPVDYSNSSQHRLGRYYYMVLHHHHPHAFILRTYYSSLFWIFGLGGVGLGNWLFFPYLCSFLLHFCFDRQDRCCLLLRLDCRTGIIVLQVMCPYFVRFWYNWNVNFL